MNVNAILTSAVMIFVPPPEVYGVIFAQALVNATRPLLLQTKPRREPPILKLWVQTLTVLVMNTAMEWEMDMGMATVPVAAMAITATAQVVDSFNPSYPAPTLERMRLDMPDG
jgi:hypothetical protein